MTSDTIRRIRSVAAKADQPLEEALKRAESERQVERLWRKDGTVWKSDDEHRKNIEGALGWLEVPTFVEARLSEIEAFADEVRKSFDSVVVLGMGGSSLCPEVLRRSIGSAEGFPQLHVLDSTVPEAVRSLADRLEIPRTLFIVASKSGSTTEPQMFYRFFRSRLEQSGVASPGQNFIAITDPGTLLEGEAKKDGFRRIFLNPSDIGGRYSALSLFGMVPAALAGMNVAAMLRSAQRAMKESSESASEDNYSARLGLFLGVCASMGRDKLTIVASPPVDSLGLWIEQLIAESTGKEGLGVLPVVGQPLGKPSEYGADRVFVWIHTAGFEDAATEAALDALSAAGHPVVEHLLGDVLELGGEFFVWEIATAMCGAFLGINPFDQPNVQESKDNTKRFLEDYTRVGTLPDQPVVAEGDGLKIYAAKASSEAADPVATLRTHLRSVRPGDYVAITQYVPETADHDALLGEIREMVSRSLKVATTTGYGPRFLHSTGQLHKGGGANGVFIQITSEDEKDLQIPDQPFGFSVLKQCQALGDFESLANRDRRALRVHLPANVRNGLVHLRDAIQGAL